MNARCCRCCLSYQNIAVNADQLQITIAQETLVDGRWYWLRLPCALPALAGTETVYILNGTGDPTATPPVLPVSIQITDWRGRQLLSERVLDGNVWMKMVYTKNGLNDLPTFQVREGIVPIP